MSGLCAREMDSNVEVELHKKLPEQRTWQEPLPNRAKLTEMHPILHLPLLKDCSGIKRSILLRTVTSFDMRDTDQYHAHAILVISVFSSRPADHDDGDGRWLGAGCEI